MTVHHGIDSEN